MRSRLRKLPEGWYPDSVVEIDALLERWGEHRPHRVGALAAIAPHAGWAFSGRLANLSIQSLAAADTVVVIGGHLPPGYPVLAAIEDSYETPLGAFERDAELYSALAASSRLETDRAVDNTVEVELPILKARFPKARLLWLRAPAGEESIVLGSKLAAAAKLTGRRVVCLGSTDLTHYGPDYGFEPAGSGPSAEKWVREVSDKGFIDAILAKDAKAALARGGEGAACSAGAAVAALSFALESGAVEAELLDYATSLEVRRSPSFVGYCAIGLYPA